MIEKNENLLGKRVVIIGSNVDFLNLTERIFLLRGAEVVVTSDATRCLQELQKTPTSLLVVESPLFSISTIDFVNNVRSASGDYVQILLISDEDEVLKEKVDIFMLKARLDLDEMIDQAEVLLLNRAPSEPKVLDISDPTVVEGNLGNEEVKVLVIEDDPLLRNLLSYKFEKSELSFKFCFDGRDALDALAEYNPTLIVLDIMLPGRNGLDVLNDIRQIDKYKDLPVIIFSNKDSEEDRRLAQSLNASPFLIKALTNINDLINIILEKHSK